MVFWIAFDGFFFGLTYGLLQIVGEMAVLRRERLAGLSLGAYVMSKIAVLAPMLAVVATILLAALRVLDRLPAWGWATYGSLFVTLMLESLVRARARTPRLRGGEGRGAGHARLAHAVLPASAVRGRGRAGRRHGRARPGHEHRHDESLGVRVAGPRAPARRARHAVAGQ